MNDNHFEEFPPDCAPWVRFMLLEGQISFYKRRHEDLENHRFAFGPACAGICISAAKASVSRSRSRPNGFLRDLASAASRARDDNVLMSVVVSNYRQICRSATHAWNICRSGRRRLRNACYGAELSSIS